MAQCDDSVANLTAFCSNMRVVTSQKTNPAACAKVHSMSKTHGATHQHRSTVLTAGCCAAGQITLKTFRP